MNRYQVLVLGYVEAESKAEAEEFVLEGDWSSAQIVLVSKVS